MAVTVYNEAQLIKILNTAEELEAFPVEGEASLLFSFPIDELNIKSNIFLIREKPLQTPVSLSLNEVKHIGDINIDYFDVVDYNWTTETSSVVLGSRPIYNITAKEPLLPNNRYSIVVSKNLAPKFYGSEKTTSLGPSEISLVISQTANITNIPDDPATEYEVRITANSILASGTHTVTYSLYKDAALVGAANQTLEIKTQDLTVNNGVVVKFNPNIPFLNGEKFKIYLTAFERAGITRVQKITTYLDAETFPVPANEQSTRLSQQSLLEFYEKYGFSRRVGTPEASIDSEPTVTETKGDPVFRFIYPNQLQIDLGEEVDEDTLEPGMFKITVGPAFDNYFLADLGYYDPAKKYVFKYKLIENDFGVKQIIRLLVLEDTDNIVPVNDPFVIQAE